MAVAGYRRVSSVDQSLERQQLGDVDRLFEEKVSGKDRNRPELEACMAWLREGDTLRCYEVSRLGRSLGDLLDIVAELTDRGVTVEFVKEKLVLDPHSKDPNTEFQLSIWAAMAQFERQITAARRDEGIALAKAAGKYAGRKISLSPAQVREAKMRRRDGVPVARLAKDYGVTELTMSKALRGLGAYGSEAYAA